MYQNSGSSSFSYYFLKQSLDFHKPGLCHIIWLAGYEQPDFNTINLMIHPLRGRVGRGFWMYSVRLRPRRGRTLNNPRSSRGREGERSEASRNRATWGYRWSVRKDLGEVSRGRRHATGVWGGKGCGGITVGAGGHVQGAALVAVRHARIVAGGCRGCFDMSCCPRETSPRSFHAPGSVPRSLSVVVACFASPPRPFDDLGSFMVRPLRGQCCTMLTVV